jgi:hypothetical protein
VEKKRNSKCDNPKRDSRRKKILVNNLNIGDLFRIKHELNLGNERMCKMFDI